MLQSIPNNDSGALQNLSVRYLAFGSNRSSDPSLQPPAIRTFGIEHAPVIW